ncbi:glycosyltransferase family 4 protein [Fervidobacterium sp.]
MSLVVIARSNAVSPDPRVEKTALWLSQSGYEVLVLAWDRENKAPGKEFQQGYCIVRYRRRAVYGAGLKNLLKFLMFNFWIFWKLLFLKFDVVHACDLDTVVPSWFAARLKGKKVVFDIFDIHSEAHFGNSKNLLRNILKFVEKFFINHADAVIIVDDSRRQQIDGTKPRRLEVIYNVPDRSLIEVALNSQMVESRENVENRRLRIGYVGVLQEGRMLKELLELVGNSENLELYIAGFGILEDEVEKAVEKYSNVYFFGKVSYEQALKIYSKCDVIFAVYDPTIPNHRYSSPNKVFEALALGIPVIVAKGTGIDNLVVAESIGYVVEYGNLEEIKSVFYEVWHWSVEERKAFAERAMRLFLDKYSPEKMKERLLSTYSSLMMNKCRTGFRTE